MATEQTASSPEQDADEGTAEITQPIIIDLGKQKAKRIKRLKKGEGKLWAEIFDVMAEVKEMLGEEADGKLMVPIVMVYEKKGKRRRIEKLLFPLA